MLVAWYRATPTRANFGSAAAGSLPRSFSVILAKSTARWAPIVKASGFRGA